MDLALRQGLGSAPPETASFGPSLLSRSIEHVVKLQRYPRRIATTHAAAPAATPSISISLRPWPELKSTISGWTLGKRLNKSFACATFSNLKNDLKYTF